MTAAPLPAAPPRIDLDGVTYTYPTRDGAVRALEGVTLTIGPGERVAVVGQNGSGKSTLVRHLNGLLRPTGGEVCFDDRPTRRRSVADLARVVGLVFQDPDRQIFAGTVRAEVEFGPRNLGLRGPALRAVVEQALTTVGLAGDDRTNPYDLGGSRRKLLALASVLAMRTPVLVLDEPTTGQDPRGVATVRHVIDEASAAGRTVIAISHDMEFVAGNFARVIVLRQGRVVADGPPASVFAPDAWPTLRSTYLEPPLAAILGERLGLATPTPTDETLFTALGGRPAR
ncbi:MAG TPA: ABC transporter ATP-binding protein [candidate division Zixibacteria bacterium]|nr:ABC transporter ATP-binding protein [candidate division Zixibacteria bacterium]